MKILLYLGCENFTLFTNAVMLRYYRTNGIKAMFRYIFVAVLLLMVPTVAFSEQEELLTKKDIYKVMNNMLSQHVEKKQMTGDILKNSFQLYIDQFDPDRIYLFEKEVDRFLELRQSQINSVLFNYRAEKLVKYEKIDLMIQNAIKRARKYREDLLRNSNDLFESSSSNLDDLDLLDDDQKPPFAKNSVQLRSRIKDQIVEFISSERQRYGDKAVMDNRKRTIKAYLENVKYRENQYLYTDSSGNRLSPAEKESLFVMHVLKSLARSLDAHTTFLNANEAYDMKIRLEKGFQGIGVVLKQKPEGVVITRMIKDGPAKKSGLVKSGDRIIMINGYDVEQSTLEQLVDKLRDKSQKNVNLVLVRKDAAGNEQTVKVGLLRELIAVDKGRVDTEYESFENGILGKVTLHSFYQGENGITSEKDMRIAIKELQKKGRLNGLIIDLRENSGGFLNQAVKVAGLFITNGVVVISKYSSGEERYYRDMDGKISYNGPLIVLTSKATASAAEIVAQALQDYGVAIVVGDEQTYGKGTIQTQTVTDGSSSSHFKVTVGKYYTVSGKTPQVRGVKADIVVPSYYSKELIGEEYLDHPLRSDKIPNAYNDRLADVDAGLKPWYLRYYMPSLQKRETSWNHLIPGLKRNSKRRLINNLQYQKFLADDWDWNPFLDSDTDLPDAQDFQMQEAVSILKDMIKLEKSSHNVKVAEY